MRTYDLYHIHISLSPYNEYKLNLLLTFQRGFIAQSVEHRTGIAEVMGLNPVEVLHFLCKCLSYFITAMQLRSLSLLRLALYKLDTSLRLACPTSFKMNLRSYTSLVLPCFLLQQSRVSLLFLGPHSWKNTVCLKLVVLSVSTQHWYQATHEGLPPTQGPIKIKK